MSDPATRLTRHDEDHGHYTDRTLHDQLTTDLQTALESMFDVKVGHSVTGDVRHLADDAKTLADVADRILGQQVRQLEADLAHATHFLIGPYRVAWHAFRKVWEVWPDPALISLTAIDDPETYTDRDQALARAKELAGE